MKTSQRKTIKKGDKHPNKVDTPEPNHPTLNNLKLEKLFSFWIVFTF